jgi:hypothetical protein
MDADKYPQFHQFFGGYLGQDYSLFGETIPEVVGCYVKENSADARQALIGEIHRFIEENDANLDEAFEQEYGFQFDPKLWGHTTRSFFQELEQLLCA